MITSRTMALFHEKVLDDELRKIMAMVRQNVDHIPENQFKATSDDELIEFVFGRLEVLPIDLYVDRMEQESSETKIDVSGDPNRHFRDRSQPFMVPGLSVTVRVPFTGSAFLWYCRPNSFRTMLPRGDIAPDTDGLSGFLIVNISKTADMITNGSKIRQQIDNNIGEVKWFLQQVNGQVQGFNQILKTGIGTAVNSRRQMLGKFDDIIKSIAIPLKRKDGAPAISPLEIRRKLVKPLPSQPRTRKEYGISEEIYGHILDVIRHEGRSFESTPRTFKQHNEEGLRDIILAHLNGHYKGDATGETFRKQGKTDIRIMEDNRAAFVAECKVWRGPKEVDCAVDQLLSYLTWRDCKTSLIIFNQKIAGFSSIQTKLPELLRKNASFISENHLHESGEWQMIFRAADDEERHITVHVFLFDLYVGKDKNG